MFSGRMSSRRRVREEGEKPFWISYSDLMTALMVLFLVVMSVSLLVITRELLEQQKELMIAKQMMDALKAKREERQKVVDNVMNHLDSAANSSKYAGKVHIGRDRRVVEFGNAAQFDSGDFHLTSEGENTLREFVPVVLSAIDGNAGKVWFKRVVVEGFTDTDGSYLYNLDLSLKRAQSVVCALLDASAVNKLNAEQQKRVREIFLVGGFSFNSAKDSKIASRRVELRLDFQTIEENELASKDIPSLQTTDIGKCQLK
jgi:outer membrane protein OmpA-like peptidoglycan-associated protein